MTVRTRIGLLFGGRSAEHEVSVVSAHSVYSAADKSRFDVIPICIGRDGIWRLLEIQADGWAVETSGPAVYLVPIQGRASLIAAIPPYDVLRTLDVVFPVLHGPNGEDGTIQGLLQTYGVAYVGAGVLGSSIGMDKDVMKRLLLQAGLPTARGQVLYRGEAAADAYDQCAALLGDTLFLKPANTGSSVGISKVANRTDFTHALAHAFEFDHKVVVEEFIEGREIECAVIGDRNPRVSVAGEIRTSHEFYSYEAKYQDKSATTLIIPAEIGNDVASRLRMLALRAYRVLCCTGMARIDFFLDATGKLWINEINTIPGFTRHSLFPLLWAHTGVAFPDLVETLVRGALRRHEQDSALRRNR